MTRQRLASEVLKLTAIREVGERIQYIDDYELKLSYAKFLALLMAIRDGGA